MMRHHVWTTATRLTTRFLGCRQWWNRLKEGRKMAYASLVQSLMEYCATVWDPHLQKDIDKLAAYSAEGHDSTIGTVLLESQDMSKHAV